MTPLGNKFHSKNKWRKLCNGTAFFRNIFPGKYMVIQAKLYKTAHFFHSGDIVSFD